MHLHGGFGWSGAASVLTLSASCCRCRLSSMLALSWCPSEASSSSSAASRRHCHRPLPASTQAGRLHWCFVLQRAHAGAWRFWVERCCLRTSVVRGGRLLVVVVDCHLCWRCRGVGVRRLLLRRRLRSGTVVSHVRRPLNRGGSTSALLQRAHALMQLHGGFGGSGVWGRRRRRGRRRGSLLMVRQGCD